MYTNISKPTGASYTNISKPTGAVYISIAKPTGATMSAGIAIGMITGLLIPFTYAMSVAGVLINDPYTKIAKPI